MSVSGRSAMPTDRPSSIQKPIPSSAVRSVQRERDQPGEAERDGDPGVPERARPAGDGEQVGTGGGGGHGLQRAQEEPMTHFRVLAMVGKRGSFDSAE